MCTHISHFQKLQGNHLWQQRSFAKGRVWLGTISRSDYKRFFTRRLIKLSRPDGFILYCNFVVDFLSTSELMYPNMKFGLWLIRARPNFHMISDNPNVSLGIVDCLLYNRRIALKHDIHRKKNGYACIHSCGVQLFGDYSKDFYHSR